MNKKVYVLDDSKVSRSLIEKKLESGLFKIDVICFNSSDELIKAVDKTKPDVIIIDFHLGHNITSPSVIKAIRKKNQEVLIINISTEENPKIAMKAMKAGANNFSFKRDFNRIIRMIKNHLRIRSKMIRKGEMMSDIMALMREKKMEKLTSKENVPLSKLLHDTFVNTTFNGEVHHNREEQVASEDNSV